MFIFFFVRHISIIKFLAWETFFKVNTGYIIVDVD